LRLAADAGWHGFFAEAAQQAGRKSCVKSTTSAEAMDEDRRPRSVSSRTVARFVVIFAAMLWWARSEFDMEIKTLRNIGGEPEMQPQACCSAEARAISSWAA